MGGAVLKRIEKDSLRLGMFIESLEGVSINSPLASRRFILNSEEDLQALRESNLSGAYINTAKGADCSTRKHGIPAGPGSNPDASKVYESIQDAKSRVEALFDVASAGGKVTFELASDIVLRITESMEVNPALLIGLTRLKSKDDATFLHSIAVSALMFHFARHLNIDSDTAHLLGVAGLLHDIGKTSIPDEVLAKPGSLTSEEMDVMREHPSIGAAMLAQEPRMNGIVLDVCLHHHERPDGKGYPFGVCGAKLSVHARIAAICDVYDAVTSTRPYKKAWTSVEAARWMMGRSGQFDDALLCRFWISLAL